MKKLIKYRDLKKKNDDIVDLTRDFKKYLNSGQYLPGKYLKIFENKIAQICKKKYCQGLYNQPYFNEQSGCKKLQKLCNGAN